MAQIVIACDSFKNCMSSTELCSLIGKYWMNEKPNDFVHIQAIGDGGEGSLKAIQPYIKAHEIRCSVLDPLFREKEATFLMSTNTAFIELAQASGIEHVDESDKDCLYSSSYGTGQMIKYAVMLGANEIFLFIGGSATHDIGFGMAEALGFYFFDDQKKVKTVVPVNIPGIHRIVEFGARALLKPIRFTILTDVNNPLTGENGAANVYSLQKGASTEESVLLEKCSIHAKQILNIDDFAGAGAAGGLAYGAKYFLNAKIESGIEFINKLTNLEKSIRNADLVITGEGAIDDQSIHGKLISGIAAIAKRYEIPCLAICAINRLGNTVKQDLNLSKIYPLFKQPQKKIDIAETILRLEKTIKQMVKEWKIE
jgi:glycerate kinase